MAERDKRRYFSPTRREQAGATRLAIVRAARELFAQRGYTATTIEAIAGATGVAVQTVYATLGSKRAILAALIDLVKEETDVAGNYTRLMTEDDPREQLRLVAHLTRRYSEGAWDVVELLRGAGAADAELASAWQAVEEQRLHGIEAQVRELERRGALRAGLSVERARDIEWALNSSELYRLLVVERGWSGDDYERWLTESMEEQLLEERSMLG